eukprot:comp11956_c0_seq1/m.6639 comp11956_c0_seq1/g.6639  ORF comp11956_c0_seq1/g.6639 comp11956_c0_seq1/m.6639 type:complete len:402 (-) comp11956_c0_seq1:75-1280(-)
MAEDQRTTEQKLLEYLATPETEEAHDKFLDDYIAGRVPRYKDHLDLDRDDWEEQIQSVPLFMNRAPTAEEVAKNPNLAALASIIHDESDPKEHARYYKDQGNAEFKKGDRKSYKKAIDHYTEGIKVKDCPSDIQATLYSNRAAANLALGNYRSTVEDCDAAKKLDPQNVKVYFRAAKALSSLDKFAEAYKWCDDGLAVDPSNSALVKERAEIKTKQVAAEKRRRFREREEKKEREKYEGILQVIKSRGITLGPHPEQLKDAEAKGRQVNVLENPTQSIATVDSEGVIHWPVFFLYPEYSQSDFIAAFAENITMEDMLVEVFGSTPAWDRKGQYRPENIDVYFDYTDEKNESILVKVKLDTPLVNILRHKRFVVRGGIPQFYMISKDSPYRSLYFSRFKDVK